MGERYYNNDTNMPKLSENLLCFFQNDFPVVSSPFMQIAESLNCSEDEVIQTVHELCEKNYLSRVGPVFDHQRAGASILAAISVPIDQQDRIAAQINSYSEVNHNYAREHAFNLWFVVTAPDENHLSSTLLKMENDLGFPILRLPMIKSYHINLGFKLHAKSSDKGFHYHLERAAPKRVINTEYLLPTSDHDDLRVMIQSGISLVHQPFADLALRLSRKSGRIISEYRVLNTINYWLQTGLIKRFGLITNHYKMGYQSSAMVVWNIPDDKIDQVGEKIKASGLVSLCYQRLRSLPEWPYNLFCMIHSQDRASVVSCVEELIKLCGLSDIQREVLFTTQQYKQKGGVYTYEKHPIALEKEIFKPDLKINSFSTSVSPDHIDMRGV